jgi:hypothetical protein
MKMQAFHLKSNVATQELKSLDRFWNQWWSMLFNSMILEKPYHSLNNGSICHYKRCTAVFS